MKNPFKYSQFDARVILGKLTKRELEFSESIAMGEEIKDIAKEHGMTRLEAYHVIETIRRKFGITNIYQLGRIWFCGVMDAFDPECSKCGEVLNGSPHQCTKRN